MFKFLKKIFGNKYDRDIKELRPIVDEINGYYESYESLSNDELRNKTIEFRARISEGLKSIDNDVLNIRKEIEAEKDVNHKHKLFEAIDNITKERDKVLEEILEEILPEAFAVVKEAARRFTQNSTIKVKATDFDRQLVMNLGENSHVAIEGDDAIWSTTWNAGGNEIKWNMIHYDVQLIGGIVLHQGKIAEMATGEGKTLVSTLPAYLNGLAGQGVHIITVNNYLATRDAEWMGPLFNFLLLTVDCIDKYKPHTEERKKAYRCDITYGTNNEFGFDYLRDNMIHAIGDKVQGKFHYTMIDEVDSVLIDDARTPLIISGPVGKDNRADLFQNLKPAVQRLVTAQRKLVGELLRDAKKKLQKGDKSPEEGGGGLSLFRVHRGLPKLRPLIKYLGEPGNMAIMRNTENFYLQEQSKHMAKADAPLYFVIEEKNRSVELTEKGAEFLGGSDGSGDNPFILDDLGGMLAEVDQNESLTAEDRVKAKDEVIQRFAAKTERIHALKQLLKAYTLFEKEEEYVVMDDKVKIVDEQTGRIMEGRRYSDGLHQAIEAKENVEIEGTTQTYATVTLQNFFRMYHKLAGMTGTAETEAKELWDIYKLDVVVIPTNRPIARDDRNDLVYKTEGEKYNAIIEEAVKLVGEKRPVLVGTTSVQSSERLSRLLQMRGIQHNVLNAKQHAREADIVAEAGIEGQVTIATNMAGRGTDIKLSEEVKKAGGLAIIGTERHDSRRVDRQLRGRAGRQGDVGSSQFFVSLEDKLMRLFGSERIAKLMDRLGHKEGDVLSHSMITKSIERAQKKVEENNFGVRKRLLEYDDVMNIQREAIYKRRDNALEGDRLSIDLNDMFYNLASSLILKAQNENNYNLLKEDMIRYFGLEPSITSDELLNGTPKELIDKMHLENMEAYDRKFNTIIEMVLPIIERVYNDPESKYTKIAIPFTNGVRGLEISADLKEAIETKGRSLIDNIERSITLGLLDNAWKEHLRHMDELKDQVQSASFEQKDPLVVYKIEAFELFKRFLNQVNQEVASFLFRGMIPIQSEEQVQQARIQRRQSEEVRTNMEEQKRAEEMQRQAAQQAQGGSEGETITKTKTVRRTAKKIGRNDLCPCGCGKKYKNCPTKKR
ncbi:MAG: preprotein translocase subunit SecA [Saprospiraceae bacterium]|nr:preprotein translocase subunit SecA [Saprospiraceae bacterium]